MLHLVLDTIPVRVFWKDRDSVYLGCNRLFAQDVGLANTDDVVGRRDHELPGLGVNAAAYQADDLRVMQSGRPKLNYEETVNTAAGTRLTVLTNKLPLWDSRHRVIGLLGAYSDVTERKAADAALERKRHEEQEHQSYLTALHEITLELTRAETLDAFYRIAVAQCRQRFGFERVGLLLYDSATDRAIGTYGTDLQGHLIHENHLTVDPDSLTSILRRTSDRAVRFAFDEHAQLFANLQPIGTGHNAAAALWNRGLLGWLTVDNAIHHRPIRQTQLDILALYALTTGSLLARKRAEFALRDSEERYRTLIHTMSEGIVLQDVNGAIQAWNPAAERILALSAAEIAGRTSFDHHQCWRCFRHRAGAEYRQTGHRSAQGIRSCRKRAPGRHDVYCHHTLCRFGTRHLTCHRRRIKTVRGRTLPTSDLTHI